MLTSSPPRGIGECGFWGWWVAVEPCRGALCASVSVGKETLPLELSHHHFVPPSLDRGRQGLYRCPQRRAGACSRRFTGKVTLLLESHKDSFVDPGARHGFCIGSLRLIVIMRSKVQGSLSKTSQQLFRHKRVFVCAGVPRSEQCELWGFAET